MTCGSLAHAAGRYAALVAGFRAEIADQLLDTVGRQGMAEEVALNGIAHPWATWKCKEDYLREWAASRGISLRSCSTSPRAR